VVVAPGDQENVLSVKMKETLKIVLGAYWCRAAAAKC